MKTRYRLIRRGIRGDTFYCVDTTTGKRTSLGTDNEDEARQVIEARNNAQRQPVLNLQIAKAYLAGTDNGITTRTWQNALDALIQTKLANNQSRWKTAAKDKALAPLLPRLIIDTPGERLLQAMQAGTVSTNVYLRRLHNFCVDMNWLPWPLIPKRQWPAVKFKEKRAITLEEHQRIITPVDLGYHYPAVDANGNPIDTDGDGVPDYISDPNGNGLPDAWEMQYFGNLNHSASELDGVGNTLLFDYQHSANPNVPRYDAAGGMTFTNGLKMFIFEPKPASQIP
jgi:hypothetical protein